MEKVSEIMTKDPACCTPEMNLQDAAEMMIKFDCGEIPVVDTLSERRIVGVITDRDICCRTVGVGLNPLEMKVSDAMTFPAISVKEGTDFNVCAELMERNRVRRIPVVDDYDKLVGIVSMVDIVRKEEGFISDIMREISKPKSLSVH